MSWIDKLGRYVPEVKRPLRKVSLAERLRNTAIILIAYVLLMSTKLPTLNPEVLDKYKMIQFIMGTKIGSIVTIGTSAIVVGALIAEFIGFSDELREMVGIGDIETVSGRDRLMKFQKLLIILFTVIYGILYSFILAKPNAIDIIVKSLAFILGGFIVYLMDDYISKYGFGSGISWFILLSVSNSIITGLFDPLKDLSGRYYGFVWRIVDYFVNPNAQTLYGDFGFFFNTVILPIIMTFVLLFIIVYLDKTKIRLARGRLARVGDKYYKLPPVELKLTYLTVIPIIFAYFTLNFVTSVLSVFKSNPTVYRILTYLYAPFGYMSWYDWEHWVVYSIVFGFLGIVMGVAFSKLLKLDEASIGEALKYYYAEFRRVKDNPAIKRAKLIMKAYPYVSATIAVLIALAGNFFGVLGMGAGLILLVGIVFQFRDYWEQMLKREKKTADLVLEEAFGDVPVIGAIVKRL